VEELKLCDIHAFNPSPQINEFLIIRSEKSIGKVIDKLNELIRKVKAMEVPNAKPE
jgi:3-hydroxyacyl-CoA dehydrogenase